MTHNSRLSISDLEYIAAHAEADLLALQHAHLLMTGCTGFIGKWLCEFLLWANESMDLRLHMTVLSRSPDHFLEAMPHLRQPNSLTFLTGDIASFTVSTPFTHAIHGANLLNDCQPLWALRHMDAAVDGIRRITAQASACGCASILYLSSGAAYRAEQTSPEPVSHTMSSSGLYLREQQSRAEDNTCEPHVYALTKRFMETYATSAGEACGIRVPLARCFSFVGPHIPLNGPQALGNFLRDALAGRDIVIKGDGTPVRSYMYGADLVIWLLALLLRGRHGIPYNVGSDEAFSVAQTARLVAQVTCDGVDVTILGKSQLGNAPLLYVPDIRRAREEFGLEQPMLLELGLSKTVAWMNGKTF